MNHPEGRPDPFRRSIVLGAGVLGAASLAAGCRPFEAAMLPDVSLPPIGGLKTNGGWEVPGVETARLAGQVIVLNVWASWCPYCKSERDILRAMAASGQYKLIGLVHRDTADNARAYLLTAGNPFAAISVDTGGRIGNALGQRGVPHTYVIGRDRKVALKIAGALTEDTVRTRVLPAVEAARKA